MPIRSVSTTHDDARATDRSTRDETRAFIDDDDDDDDDARDDDARDDDDDDDDARDEVDDAVRTRGANGGGACACRRG